MWQSRTQQYEVYVSLHYFVAISIFIVLNLLKLHDFARMFYLSLSLISVYTSRS
jgi:hypothetical protein